MQRLQKIREQTQRDMLEADKGTTVSQKAEIVDRQFHELEKLVRSQADPIINNILLCLPQWIIAGKLSAKAITDLHSNLNHADFLQDILVEIKERINNELGQYTNAKVVYQINNCIKALRGKAAEDISLTLDDDKKSGDPFHIATLNKFMEKYPELVKEIVRKVVIKNLKLVDAAAEDAFMKTAKVSSKITVDISKMTANLKSLIQTFSKVYFDRKRSEIEGINKHIKELTASDDAFSENIAKRDLFLREIKKFLKALEGIKYKELLSLINEIKIWLNETDLHEHKEHKLSSVEPHLLLSTSKALLKQMSYYFPQERLQLFQNAVQEFQNANFPELLIETCLYNKLNGVECRYVDPHSNFFLILSRPENISKILAAAVLDAIDEKVEMIPEESKEMELFKRRDIKYLNGLSEDIYNFISALHVNNKRDYETIIQNIIQCFIDKYADFVHPDITKVDPGRLAMLVSPPDEKFQAKVKNEEREQKGKSTRRQTLLDAEWMLDTSIVPESKEIKSPVTKVTEECSLSTEEIFKGAFLSQVNVELCAPDFIRNSHLESRFAEAATDKKRAYEAGLKAGQEYKLEIGDAFVAGDKQKAAAQDAYLSYKNKVADLKRQGFTHSKKSFAAHQRAITPTPMTARENKGERKAVSPSGFLSPKLAASSISGSVPKGSGSDDPSLLPGVVNEPKTPKSRS